MKGYVGNIETMTLVNKNFRSVLYTSKFSQLVVMTLQPGEEIGDEIHDVDQFFRFEKGQGKVIIDGVTHDISDGFAVVVPASAKHNIINTSMDSPLFLYTLYCPPHHRDRVVHATKAQAQADTEHFDNKTSE